MGNINACNHGIQRSECSRHVNDPLVPSSVSGNEENQMERMGGFAIQGDFSEAPIVKGLFRRLNPPSLQHETETERKDKPSHFVTTPFSPPEIREAISTSILGNISPPGEAIYLGSQRGSNFSLYSRKPLKL